MTFSFQKFGFTSVEQVFYGLSDRRHVVEGSIEIA
jgi:hypothetical protein